MKYWIFGAVIGLAAPAHADQRTIYAVDNAGDRIAIADLNLATDGTYAVTMNSAAFGDHFLSMRPFKCLESAEKHWCHVPYPYQINRNISADFVDLEYDLLFVWKGANDYGINMWNGVYYRISDDAGTLTGEMLELDMDVLSVPPPAGELRPLKASDLHESDPDGHWLPRLVIE